MLFRLVNDAAVRHVAGAGLRGAGSKVLISWFERCPSPRRGAGLVLWQQLDIAGPKDCGGCCRAQELLRDVCDMSYRATV